MVFFTISLKKWIGLFRYQFSSNNKTPLHKATTLSYPSPVLMNSALVDPAFKTLTIYLSLLRILI